MNAEKLEQFRARLEAETIERLKVDCPVMSGYTFVTVRIGKKFAKVDILENRSSGTGRGVYMVDLADGTIYGIKAYGVVHRGHVYGNLDTIDDWNWGDFKAVRKIMAKAEGVTA